VTTEGSSNNTRCFAFNFRIVGLGFVTYVQHAGKSAGKTIACQFVPNKEPKQLELESVLRASAGGLQYGNKYGC
jgi:hypothetical protein